MSHRFVRAVSPRDAEPETAAMKELFRTNDPVLLSWAISLLESEGIEPVVLDMHTSILEGSIGILPRRLMVADDDYTRAHHLIETQHPEGKGSS